MRCGGGRQPKPVGPARALRPQKASRRPCRTCSQSPIAIIEPRADGSFISLLCEVSSAPAACFQDRVTIALIRACNPPVRLEEAPAGMRRTT